MATVPVQTSPSVALSSQGPANVQAGPDVRPFENFAPKQIAEAGAASMKLNSTIATIKEKLQDEYNDARTKELFNQYTREVDKVATSFLAQTGNISQSYDQSLASIQEIQSKFSSAADNQTIKMGFSQKADALTTSVAGTLTRHSLAQSREYANNEAKSEIGTFVQQASTHWAEAQLPLLPDTPPNEYQKFAGAAITAVTRYADKQGWAPDSYQRQQMTMEVNTALTSGVVVNMATAGQHAAADAYLEKAFKDGKINQEKYGTFKNALKEGITRDNANSYADAIYGGFAAQGVAAKNSAASGVKTGPATGVTFESNIAQLLLIEGGGKFVANDGGKGPTKYGINGQANGLTEQQVMNLTQAQAIDIYKKKYWDEAGIAKLPEAMRATAFDAAVNQGVGAMQEMLKSAKKADGTYDVAKFNQVRLERYATTLLSSPFYKNLPEEEKAKYRTSWANRVSVSTTGGTKSSVALDADTGLPNLASMIQHARDTIPDINERNAAIAIISQRHGQAEAAWTQNYQNVLKTSSDIALSAPGAWTKVPAAMWSQLRPADKIALQGGPDRGTNADTQIFLERNSQEWAPGKIEKYRSQLSESVFLSYVSRHQTMIKSGQTAEEKNFAVAVDMTDFDMTIMNLGQGRQPVIKGQNVSDWTKLVNPKTNEEKTARLFLQGQLEQTIDQEQKRLKRTLSREEKNGIMTRIMLDQVSIDEWGSDRTVSMFEVNSNKALMKDAYVVVPGAKNSDGGVIKLTSIPNDVRTLIVDAYKKDPVNAGRNPTQQEIAETWVKFGQPKNAAEAKRK